MSNEPNTTLPAVDVDPSTEASGTPPSASETVSRAEFDRIVAQNAHLEQRINDVIGIASARTGVTPPPAPEPKRYTDAELQEMIDNGNSVQAYRIINAQALEPLIADYGRFKADTLTVAGQIGKRAFKDDMPYADDPIVKKDMDDFMARLSPEAQANPEAWQLAHNTAVGKPENLKRIIEREVETRMRRTAEPTPTADAHGSRPRVRAPGEIPSPEEILGDEHMAMLTARGQTAEQFVQRLGYESWDDYYTKTELEPNTMRFN